MRPKLKPSQRVIPEEHLAAPHDQGHVLGLRVDHRPVIRVRGSVEDGDVRHTAGGEAQLGPAQRK